MKKRILGLVLGICMTAALTACGSAKISNDTVTVNNYKGLKVEAVQPEEVTEEAIDSSIAYTLQVTAMEYGITDRAAADGDTVIIDYTGKVDDVAFEGGSATQQPLTLGSDTFIDGFEDAIVGHTPGETFDIDVTFPENYGSEDLAGQDAVFTIVLHVIVPTELTDEIATGLCGKETTVEEYRQIVKEDLEVSNQESADAQYSNVVYAEFIKNCEMKEYPEDELNKWIDIMNDSYAMYASYYGMETDEYLQANYGVTCEDLAKEQICFAHATALIAEEEGIELTAEEYETQLVEQATQFGYESPEEYEASYEEYYGEGYLKDYMLQEMVMAWIVDNSIVK